MKLVSDNIKRMIRKQLLLKKKKRVNLIHTLICCFHVALFLFKISILISLKRGDVGSSATPAT